MKSNCLLALVIFSLFGAPACSSKSKQRNPLAEVDRLPRLETIQSEMNVHPAVKKSYVATVEAFERADLCAQVKGTVKILPETVDIGRRVRKDDVLIVLDIPDILADR